MTDSKTTELSAVMLEVGAKFFPRRYRRFRDLRPYQQARDWARNLDWRQNPYDRFLLRREILHHLENTLFYAGPWNIFSFASREEIAAEVDRLLNEYTKEDFNVFSYVVVILPWHVAFKHGRVEYNRLEGALANLPSKAETGTHQATAL